VGNAVQAHRASQRTLFLLRGWPGKREIHWAGQRGNKQSMGREEFVDLPNTLAFP